MIFFQRKMRLALCAAVCGANLLAASAALGQTAMQTARVASEIRNDQLVTLHGGLNPMARPANDRGALPAQQPITKMHLLLQRSAAQEAALQTLMEQQQDPRSPQFHAWLTPQEFGRQFGPADSDVQAVKDWLTSQGFSNLNVNNGKTLIVFDGTAGAVRNAFHTEVHRLAVAGEEHFANMQEPQIPAALAPVVAGIAGLHNFHPKSQMKQLGTIRRNATTGEVTPLFTYNFGQGLRYGVSPADFKTIYNVPAAYTGAGQSIAIVGQSNINLADIADFRSIFSLPANPPKVILNGADPGLQTATGDEGESVLDVEWAGAVAPNATIDFVVSEQTETDGLGGVDTSAVYIVDNNVAPVLSYSYGICESFLVQNGAGTFYGLLWQQAAAEGITVVVAAGDNGSAGCDDPNTENKAASGIAVSGTASTPYNVAMGGTDFDQAGKQSTYWNTCTITAPANTCSTAQLSAKSYIPEIPWNDSCAANATSADLTICANATTTSTSSPLDISAGSGGPSTIYSKPSWQTGITGMPNDGKRDLPDISLFSALGGNASAPSESFYIVCQSDQDITGDTGCSLNITTGSSCPTGTCYHDFQAIGGTSAAAPTFAAIMALVNQRTGQRQGNANPTLYALAKSESFSSCNSSSPPASTCVFNDVTKGTNSVPCTGNTANCSTTTASAIGILVSSSAPAYTAGTGYDLATGLGSVNVTNLVNNWAAPGGLISTSVTLSSSAAISGTAGSSAISNITMTGKVSQSAATGAVILENAATGATLDSMTLTNAAYTETAAFLPAGSYSLKAHYGGDSTYTPSDSPTIAVNLSKQNSSVIVSFVAFANASAPPPVLPLSTAAQNVQYGSNYILRVDVAGTSSGSAVLCTDSNGNVISVCPTGLVSLFDNKVALTDFPNAQNPNATNVSSLNERGFTEDQPIQLGVGSHSITATYTAAANSSYTSPASSNTLSITITQAATTAAVAASPTSIASGGSVRLTALVSSSSNSSQGPTGTVQFLNGGASLGSAQNCVPAGATTDSAGNAIGASCTATFQTALSALPPGIINVRPPKTPFVILAWLMVALAMLNFLLVTRLAARRKAYAYAGVAFFLIAAAALAGCGGGSSGGGGGTPRSISAKYSGDTNYAGSTSSAVTVTIQ